MSEDLERLVIRNGEKVTDVHVRKLAAAVASDKISGRGVRQRKLPWGTITHFEGGQGGGASNIFAPTVTRSRDGFLVSFAFGLIGGVEPSIGGIGISRIDPATGRTPQLLVPTSLFATGEVGIYFRCTLTKEWSVEKAEPIASAEVPKLHPWVADKLAALIKPNGEVWRALYFNLGHEAIRKGFIADGRATHLFFAT